VNSDDILPTGVRVRIPHVNGVWTVVRTEGDLTSKNPRMAGWFRARLIHGSDGHDGGPTELEANFLVADALLITDDGTEFPVVLWTGAR
jgi:hypothetical protein